jgi:UDP-2-acetamido-3-amino-2,3-dideoxy-glucuronate N-acetyltransferase
MVGAGAVVSRDVPANAIVVGNSARVIGFVGVDQQPLEARCSVFASTAVADDKSGRSPRAITEVDRLVRLDCHRDNRGSLAVASVEKKNPFRY